MTGLIILSILATMLMLGIDYQDHHPRSIMKRITILIAVAITIALAGCGGQSACDQVRSQAAAEAHQWTNDYVQGLPEPIDTATKQQLYENAYQADLADANTQKENTELTWKVCQ